MGVGANDVNLNPEGDTRLGLRRRNTRGSSHSRGGMKEGVPRMTWVVSKRRRQQGRLHERMTTGRGEKAEDMSGYGDINPVIYQVNHNQL
jgi:hypothetical protein